MDNLFFIEAKCAREKQTFYIRFDKGAHGIWCQTYGVKAVPQGASGAVSNRSRIDVSKVVIGPQYKCPYCGNTSYVQCGCCNKISCMPSNSDTFVCAHCGVNGRITGRIQNVDGKSGIGQ